MSDPAGPPVLVAGAHRAQVLEAQFGVGPTDGDPAVHAAAVAVDAVPHQHLHKPTDLLEAFGAIELDHADGVLVAALFGDEVLLRADRIVGLLRRSAGVEIGLSAAGSQAR